MESDSGSRQLDRDQEPDSMRASVDADSTKDSHHEMGKQPEQAIESTTPTNPEVTVVLQQSREGDSPTRMPEQRGKTPQLGVLYGPFLQTLNVNLSLLGSSTTTDATSHPRCTHTLRPPAAGRQCREEGPGHR